MLCGVIIAQESQDYREALKALSLKAEEGDAKALYELGRLHDTGFDTIPVDTARSSALYLLSANKGYAPAQNYIGFRYYNGEGIAQNLDSAIYWIKAAAAQGDITAASNIGYLLLDSPEIPHDTIEALNWLEIAAEGGVRDAQIKLVELRKDYWRTLPADSALVRGMKLYLGRAPLVGVKLLERAAEENNPKALALLGDAYSNGRGIPYDHQKSVEFFYEAALAGNPSAQFIIAELLEFFPDDLPDSSTTATFWYEKAAEAGITDSETAYRLLYTIPEIIP